MKEVCVVINGTSSGKQYPKLFKAKGFSCVHVNSRAAPLKTGSKFNPDDYIDCLTYNGNISDIVQELKKYKVICVIPGAEPGVLLADLLSEELGLATTNGTKKSKARRDKYEMDQVLLANQLKVPLHFKSNDVNKIIDWIKSNTTWPVVIKALDSSGTDGVFICHNDNEVVNSFHKLINQENFMGQINSEILVQSYLRGEEYVVNSVSCNGKHYVTDIWKYKKKPVPGYGMVYDRDELLSFDGKVQSQIVQYANKVLDALEIKYGPSHAEIMLTADGPVLVEVGARLSGSADIALSDECIGYNSVQLAVDCYVDQKAFHAVVRSPFQIKKQAMIVELANEQEGIVESIPFLEEMKKIPSARAVLVKVKPRDVLKKTTDLFSSLASIQLVHDSKEQLEADYLTVKKLQCTGFVVKKPVIASALVSQGMFSLSSKAIEKPQNDNKQNTHAIRYGLFALAMVGMGVCVYQIFTKKSGANPDIKLAP